MEYTLLVIADRRSISLVQRKLSEEQRKLELQINGRYVGVLDLLPTDLPSVTSSSHSIVIWGGRRLYLIDWGGQDLRRFDRDEPVHAIYPVGDQWLLVCETSVVLVDHSGAAELARYEHGEVLLSAWWVGDRVMVMDFNGRRLTFDPAAAACQLQPLSD